MAEGSGRGGVPASIRGAFPSLQQLRAALRQPIGYIPTNPANWATQPDSIQEALDILAAGETSPEPAGESVTFSFTSMDWEEVDDGLNWALDVPHDLETIYVRTILFEDNEEVAPQTVRILDANEVRFKVSRRGSDARFSGRGMISPR